MTRKLHISKDLALPLDAVTQTLVVYGGKGMGKTNLGSVFAEELARARQRFSVIDPLGVWYGVRHAADGKGPGIEVLILGGVHGDIPIEPTGGAVVADLVADENVSVIVDISRRANGQMWSQGERIRFVTDYCTRLFARQGEQRRAIMQVIDECGRFCPQQIPSGAKDIAMCVGAIEQLVEWGRNVGIGVLLITQRSARMNKSISELADAMIAFRTVGPNSMAAVMDWLGEHVPKARHRELSEQLRSVPRGSALVVSPGWLEFEGVVAVRMRETFDSSATPKAGEKARRIRGGGAKPNLAKYQERMAETIERAKADDPKALRLEIAELKKQAAKHTSTRETSKSASAVEVKVDQRAIDRAIAEAQREFHGRAKAIAVAMERVMKILVEINAHGFDAAGVKPDEVKAALQSAIDSAMQRMEGGIERRNKAVVALKQRVEQVMAEIDRLRQDKVLDVKVQVQHREPFKVEPKAERVRSNEQAVAPVVISGGIHQRILDALAWWETLDVKTPHRNQVAWVAGSDSASGGYFSRAVGELKTAGQVEYPGPSLVKLTDAGRAAAGEVERPEDADAFINRMRSVLSGIHLKLFDAMLKADATGGGMTRAELAAAIGSDEGAEAGGYFSRAVGELKTMGFITYPAKGSVALSELITGIEV